MSDFEPFDTLDVVIEKDLERGMIKAVTLSEMIETFHQYTPVAVVEAVTVLLKKGFLNPIDGTHFTYQVNDNY